MLLSRKRGSPKHKLPLLSTSQRKVHHWVSTPPMMKYLALTAAFLVLLSFRTPDRDGLKRPQLIDQLSLPVAEGDLVDVVYVYANKTHPRIVSEFQQLSQATTNTANHGVPRSPPTGEKSEDLDLMHWSVKMTKKMAQNLGTIFIMVTYPEEVSEELQDMDGVQIVLESEFYEGLHFSSNAAEAQIHKIPGLSRLYIAMNDDMVMTKPVNLREYFFTELGAPRTFAGTDCTIESFPHTIQRIRKPQNGGARPQVKYTLNELSKFTNVGPLRRKYPSHAPRPFDRLYVQAIEDLDPELFQSPLATHFRCQQCLNVHMLSILHSYEAGTLRDSKGQAKLAYVDSASIWGQVLNTWDQVSFITIQEVSPEMHKKVLAFLRRQGNFRSIRGTNAYSTTLISA